MHCVTKQLDYIDRFCITKHLISVESCRIREPLSILTFNSIFYLVKHLVLIFNHTEVELEAEVEPEVFPKKSSS